MYDLTLIGIGTGNPDHLTFAGAQAMRDSDLILIPRKGADKSDLAGLRREMCNRVLGGTVPVIAEFDVPVRDGSGDYLSGVDDWHAAIARAWADAIAAFAPEARNVALLIWGDPSLYDSALRIAARMDPAPRCHVVPGITALQALTAAHAIAINDIGAPFVVTTGRRLRDDGWPMGVDTVAVMLDGQCSFQTLAPDGIEIWWGAFLGMPEQVLVAGPLAEVTDDILRTRAEERARHGWIMDIYLLRRQPQRGGDNPA